MADVVIKIPVSSIQYTAWLRTSYIGKAVVSEGGTSMVEQMELGVDQGDALMDFLDEATREVLKVFLSRQGDVTGVPFEYDAVNVTYRFNEATPVMKQAVAIKEALKEDVRNAIFSYVAFLWFQTQGIDKQSAYVLSRYEKLVSNIDRHLYNLHD